jgi:hypothetical protein
MAAEKLHQMLGTPSGQLICRHSADTSFLATYEFLRKYLIFLVSAEGLEPSTP